jgi:hypothetical protein
MAMPGKPEPGVWSEARDLLLRWEALTGEIGERLPNSSGATLLPLLAERRGLCRQLDALKEEHGISTWNGYGDEGSAVQEEVAAIGRRLLVEDERLRRSARHKMDALQEQIARLRQARVAAHTYHGRRRTVKGAFIDARL